MSDKNKDNKKLEDHFLKAYDEYGAQILRHIYFRVNNKGLAEDLVSETFMKTWQYLREGNKIKNIKSFLYKVSNNLIIDHYRVKYKETIPIEDIPEPAEPAGGDLEESVDFKNLSLEIINDYLNMLSDEHKQILVYRYVDELDIGEIKELTGKSTANIYTIIHRALKSLRKILNEADYEKGN